MEKYSFTLKLLDLIGDAVEEGETKLKILGSLAVAEHLILLDTDIKQKLIKSDLFKGLNP